MKSGKLLLSGLIITGCMGLATGCSSAPAKKGSTESAQLNKQKQVKTEYIIRNEVEGTAQQVPEELSLGEDKQSKNKQNAQYLARKNEQKRLRLQRHKEWEAKQRQEQQRAEYQREWQQKQQALKLASAKQARSPAQSRESVQTDARRQQYQQQWQQQQARRLQYQQQWQQQQRKQQAQQQVHRVAQQQTQQQVHRVAQQQTQQQVQRVAQQPTQGYGGRGTGNYSATYLGGDFAGNRGLERFINDMSARHGFNKNYLYGVFSQTRNRDSVARLWAGNNGGSSSGGKGWYNYRSKFVTPGNIQKGAQFWNQYRPHLLRASQRYNVDPEYIVGIMGVETRWGRILGKHRVIDALTTSAIVNKRRSKFFFKELENYLLMTRSERMDPLQPKGSYAGAMGYGQFMPSSFRAFAVDFNGDGVRDLWNPVDAIGSIANYFAKHNWKSGQEVAVPARVTSMAYTTMPDGYKVKYSKARLIQKGIQPRNGRWSNTGRTHLLALTTVPGGLKEPWIAYHNFYVITRYNHSNYYAMAVHQLAKAVEKKAGGGQYAHR